MTVVLLGGGIVSCGGSGGGAASSAQQLSSSVLSLSASDTEVLAGGECVSLKVSKSSTGAVTWNLGGQNAGSLSATTGDSVNYCPPSGDGTSADKTISISANVDSLVQSISLTLHPPAGLYPVAGDVAALPHADNAVIGLGTGIALDKSGKIYVSDSDRGTILAILPDGTVSNFAGQPGQHVIIDGSLKVAAFDHPMGLSSDISGNLYVIEGAASIVRKIAPNGMVTTLAGSMPGYADGTGESAQFRFPVNIASDATGNSYVADSANKSIRSITPEGKVTTLAGTCIPYVFDGAVQCTSAFADGSGTAARFSGPSGIAVDAKGTIYVADFNTIRKITPDGKVTTLAGAPGTWGNADGSGSAAQFNVIGGISVDGNGNIYAADTFNAAVRKISPAGQVTTIATVGVPASGMSQGQGTPIDLVVASPHVLYVLTSTSVQKLIFP